MKIFRKDKNRINKIIGGITGIGLLLTMVLTIGMNSYGSPIADYPYKAEKNGMKHSSGFVVTNKEIECLRAINGKLEFSWPLKDDGGGESSDKEDQILLKISPGYSYIRPEYLILADGDGDPVEIKPQILKESDGSEWIFVDMSQAKKPYYQLFYTLREEEFQSAKQPVVTGTVICNKLSFGIPIVELPGNKETRCPISSNFTVEKTVSAGEVDKQQELTLENKETSFTYTILYHMAEDLSWQDSIRIEDRLPSFVEIESAVLQGEKVSFEPFTPDHVPTEEEEERFFFNGPLPFLRINELNITPETDNTVAYTFPQIMPTGENLPTYNHMEGETYTLTIKGKIKESTTDDYLRKVLTLDGDHALMENRALLILTPPAHNGSSTTTGSNTTKVKIPVEAVPELPVGEAGITKDVEGALEYTAVEDKAFTYHIQASFPGFTQGTTPSAIQISDTLANELEILTGAQVYLEGAQDQELTERILMEGQKLSLNLEGYDFMNLSGKSITIEFNAKVKSGADLSAYLEKKIPNTATLTIGTESLESNPVYVKLQEPVNTGGTGGPDPEKPTTPSTPVKTPEKEEPKPNESKPNESKPPKENDSNTSGSKPPVEEPKPSTDSDLSEKTTQDTPVQGDIPGLTDEKAVLKEEPKNGHAEVQPQGSWKYTPDRGFTGRDSFTLALVSPNGRETDVVVDIEVEELPLGPELMVAEDETRDITGDANIHNPNIENPNILEDEVVIKGNALPKTSGFPGEILEIAGFLSLALGALIRRKHN